MAAHLTILSVGPGATIQDGGRIGWLRFGVTSAGPMDWVAFSTANRAVENEPDSAAIEIGPGGIALASDAAVTIAVAGGGFVWSLNERQLGSAARILLRPGDVLRARAGSWGSFCYCAVAGGLDVPAILGSRSTHTRSGLGGLEGRNLRAGDVLTVDAPGALLDDARLEAGWLAREAHPIRVVLGPQDDHFLPEAIQALESGRFVLTATADRMAYKLAGPPLPHRDDYNIVSDGVALGAIQVAGDRQPMVLMADRQPTGGYPKIAHVCRADIGRLAQLRLGEDCRFEIVSVETARRALLEREDQVAQTSAALIPLRLAPDARRLLQENLIDGVIAGEP